MISIEFEGLSDSCSADTMFHTAEIGETATVVSLKLLVQNLTKFTNVEVHLVVLPIFEKLLLIVEICKLMFTFLKMICWHTKKKLKNIPRKSTISYVAQSVWKYKSCAQTFLNCKVMFRNRICLTTAVFHQKQATKIFFVSQKTLVVRTSRFVCFFLFKKNLSHGVEKGGNGM